MDKQQAGQDCGPDGNDKMNYLLRAERYSERWIPSVAKTAAAAGWIAGWEAREALLSPTDAVKSECIKRDASIKPPRGGTYYTNIGEIVWNEQEELWMNFKMQRVVKWWLDENVPDKLFNPSGAAPRSMKCVCTSDREHENCINTCDWYNLSRHENAPTPLAAGLVTKEQKDDLIWKIIEYFQDARLSDDNCLDRDEWSDKVLSYNDAEAMLYEQFEDIVKPVIPQQVFTREQVEQVLKACFNGRWAVTEEQMKHFINTNYPEVKG